MVRNTHVMDHNLKIHQVLIQKYIVGLIDTFKRRLI